MIILTRSNAIYSSPRIEKYIDFVNEKGLNYLVVGWDRLGKNLQRENTVYFQRTSGYSVGGLKAAKNRFLWMWYLLTVFYKKRDQVTVIHAFDVDTAFPACVFKVFVKRDVKVIFDICDWFSDTLYNQNSLVLYIFKKMESFTIKHSDEVIICEPERINQIPYKLNKPHLVLPNIPSFDDISFLKADPQFHFDNNILTVSYVGGFSEFRLLNELLTIAERGDINLLIAGFGSAPIESRCEALSTLSNVKYYGKVGYKDGLNIMYNSDIIYAMYAKSNPNHFYAAPNKYYEAMMLGKPIISTKGISLGDKVVNNKVGYILEEDVNELASLVQNLDPEDMLKKGAKASALWEDKYKFFINNFFNQKYLEIVRS